jgi:hypothetical protein
MFGQDVSRHSLLLLVELPNFEQDCISDLGYAAS